MKDDGTRFLRNGYQVFRGLYSSAEIAGLRRHVDRIYASWRTQRSRSADELDIVNMHSLTSPAYFATQPSARADFFERLLPPKLTNRLDAIFGDGLHLQNTQLFFNPARAQAKPYWHRDLQYTDLSETEQRGLLDELVCLHVRIPLVAEAGPELIPKTHRRWDTEVERNVRLELNGRSNSDALPGSVTMKLDPGDVLLFSAHMIHRGSYVTRGRLSLDLCVGKASSLFPPDPKNLPGADEWTRLSNTAWFKTACAVAREKPTAENPSDAVAGP